MSKIPIRTRGWTFVAAALAALAMLAMTPVARAQEVVVLVDGVPITQLDVDHRAKFLEMSTHKAPTRQEATDSLIDEILELREAQHLSLIHI